MRTPSLGGRLELLLVTGSVATAFAVALASVNLLGLKPEPVVAETPVAEAPPTPMVTFTAPPTPRPVAVPPAPAEPTVCQNGGFMPDDYLEIRDIRLLCSGDRRVRISSKWPGEGYIFLGQYRGCGGRSSPLLVWFQGTEIPREFFTEAKLSRTEGVRVVDEPRRRQHLTLEYGPR